MFKQPGITIDKKKNRYQKYTTVLFFDIGSGWKKLPEIAFVALTRVDGAQTFNSPRTFSASTTLKFDLFCVYLCVDTKRKVLAGKSKNKNEALSLASDAAKYLEVELKNYLK